MPPPPSAASLVLLVTALLPTDKPKMVENDHMHQFFLSRGGKTGCLLEAVFFIFFLGCELHVNTIWPTQTKKNKNQKGMFVL